MKLEILDKKDYGVFSIKKYKCDRYDIECTDTDEGIEIIAKDELGVLPDINLNYEVISYNFNGPFSPLQLSELIKNKEIIDEIVSIIKLI